METNELGKNDAAYQAAKEFAEQSEDQNVVSVDALDFTFTYNGQPLSVEDCEVTAEVAPTEKLQSVVDDMEIAEDAEEEAGAGVELTALNVADGQAEELDTVTLEQGDKTLPKMTVALNSADPALQVVAREALNPHFTVQYYANLDVAKRDNDGYLEIINTDNGGNNQGGNLPKNGTGSETTKLYLEEAGNGKRKIATESKLTELYTANEYDYFEAPSLPYMNILRDNSNYTVNEVWVLKDGKDANSTNPEDWNIHDDPDDLTFTNSESSAGENTIVIDDNTVIRLVANTTTDTYNNAATFYDYDITDDGRTTWDGTYGAHGINSNSNYTDSGAKLAFGNANTGTSLHNESWNGNTLNQYNRSGNGMNGATFGLVTGLDGEGHIQYASGVAAPNLFDDGNATGKTTYTDWSLGFNRDGDTYTLSSVNGAGLGGLEYFNNPVTGTTVYDHIWTNNFWPMDSRAGKDGLTGKYQAERDYVGYGGNNMYPTSDDGIAHNNMFGMQYSIQFELTDDYIGPLEYYFFGDDDMWVFLDGRLVCDIGGVHSSIGEYVNLWDYIEKGTAGKHTLKFYYTERGLSGSTCYMQFTLPSVSSVPVKHDTGQLKILKQVVGTEDENLEFSFDVTLTDANENPLIDKYSIMRYTADGNPLGAELIQGGQGSFKLKADEYVIIDYLPYGTKYTITETGESDGYTVSNVVDEEAVDYDVTAEGQIQEGHNGSVVFTNTFRPKLPDTGGPGTAVITLAGTACVTVAMAHGFYQRKKCMR